MEIRTASMAEQVSMKPTNVLKEGFVTKQGGRIKTWKRRWCVLNDTGLLYYKTQPNPSLRYNNLQGQIELSTIDSVEEAKESKKKSCFQIITPGRTFLISADSDEDMFDWIRLIRALKNQKPLPTTAPPPQPKSEFDFGNKSEKELKELLNTLNGKINQEIDQLIAACLEEKDAIIEELMEREIVAARKQYLDQKQELAEELDRRSVSKA